ncbi:MAG: site-specific tyrosine recombinase XerD [Rikenellaceae bacterium]|jgi:integrase/recombinase XerD|nr:site-specific tyrosine recombinase XerD [Rikenellaceae bacterium]
MSWEDYFEDYRTYIKLEKNLSSNTLEAYFRDLKRLREFIEKRYGALPPEEVTMHHIEEFLADLYDRKVNRMTQARTLSGIKSFYNFLLVNDKIDVRPTELIQSPKTKRKLPDVLTTEEIIAVLESVDLSQEQGHRNRAIIETLYSCGLRVSEAVNLQLSDLFFDDGYMRVTGKGDKQRLVPVSGEAIRAIRLYLEQRRIMTVESKYKNILFLNNKGRPLSRVMIFMIIKRAVADTGIDKNVSPHTFRHSFATHLIQGGADIRVVQEMLGHESILTTEIYTHLNKEYLHKSVANNHPLAVHDV